MRFVKAVRKLHTPEPHAVTVIQGGKATTTAMTPAPPAEYSVTLKLSQIPEFVGVSAQSGPFDAELNVAAIQARLDEISTVDFTPLQEIIFEQRGVWLPLHASAEIEISKYVTIWISQPKGPGSAEYELDVHEFLLGG